MINEQENNDKNIKDYEDENPFDAEDNRSLEELIAEQEKNNINQIDEEDEFSLES